MKECLINVAQEICPKMLLEIQKISLLQWTVAKHIGVLADDICIIFKDKVKTLFHGALQQMEGFAADQKDTAQLAIFAKGVNRELNEMEKLWLLESIKGTIQLVLIYLRKSSMLLKLSE